MPPSNALHPMKLDALNCAIGVMLDSLHAWAGLAWVVHAAPTATNRNARICAHCITILDNSGWSTTDE